MEITYSYLKTKSYPTRYDNEDFKKYKEITKYRIITIEKYDKWKSGINWLTGRRIKIGGKLYEKLGYENFYIRRVDGCNIKYILFTEFDSIDIEIYNNETAKIKKEIDDYNLIINETNCKIKLLEKKDEFIIFDGVKYGNPDENIHMDEKGENCFGLIVKDRYEECSCNCCENWFGCSEPVNVQHYKCIKCDYKYGKQIVYEKNKYNC